MTATSLLQRTLLLVLLCLLAAIGVVLLTGPGSQSDANSAPRTQFDGPAMPAGTHAADFSLVDQAGHRVTLAEYRGQVVVLTFIHSLCHDACPFMVEQIKGALNDLPNRGQGIPVIGITVAPSEDTRASRTRFLSQHEMASRMAFLNGPLPALRTVWHDYAIQPVTPKIDHSTFVLLIDRRGIERVGFPADELTPEALAHDIRVLEAGRA